MLPGADLALPVASATVSSATAGGAARYGLVWGKEARDLLEWATSKENKEGAFAPTLSECIVSCFVVYNILLTVLPSNEKAHIWRLAVTSPYFTDC